jgi:hypothetical protein
MFHHCFLIASPFIIAILRSFLRALPVCFEWCGDGSRGRGGRVWLRSLRNCAKMQDCYPSKRATDQTKVLFHLSTPVGIVCTAKSFSKRVAVPATIPFVTPHKTNANLSRLFLPSEPRSRISGRSWPANPKRSTRPKILALLARNGHAESVAQCPLLGAKRKTCARIELFRF